MQITLIGHSTLLIQGNGLRILTDPYFSPYGNPFYTRVSPPGLPAEKFRDVDLVLVSHNHWDHIDSDFLRSLPDGVLTFAPKWVAWETRLRGAKKVVGMKPWETSKVGRATITAVPAVHVAPTVGYVIEIEGRKIYFSGDTFYLSAMHDIGEHFALDVALIPVTRFMPPMTMGEQGAVQAVQQLKPRMVIPIHLGVQPRPPFLRSRESVEGFEARLRAAGLEVPVVFLKEGQTWTQPSSLKQR